MAMKVFIKIDALKGESNDKTHTGGTGDKPSMNWNIAENSKD